MRKISRFILLALLALGAVSAHAQRTDLNPAPETVPTLCSPAPCTMTSSDLNPNVKYTRVTDGNTLAPLYSGRQFGTVNSIDNLWSSDSKGFLAENLTGSLIPIKFDPATQLASTVTCSATGPGCDTAEGKLNFSFVEAGYSFASPAVFYAPSGNLIMKEDYSAVLANPAATATETTAADASACPGIPNPAAQPGVLSISTGDQRLLTSYGGTQDHKYIIYVFDKTLGCRWLRTDTMQAGGQWGPAGAISYHDESGNVIPAVTYSDVHNSQMDPTGRWAQMQSETTNTQWNDYWDISTLNLYQCSSNVTCAGHAVWGFDNKDVFWVNQNASQVESHTFPPALPATAILPAGTYPAGLAYAFDAHLNWRNAVAGQAVPISVTPFSTSAPTIAWPDEILRMATDGSNIVQRIAHMFTRAHDFNAQGLQSVSPDGNWVIFCSDWTTTRDDLYLTRYSPAGSGPLPPAAPTSLTAVPQ